MKAPITLALADDQALIRSGLQSLLQTLGFEVRILASDGDALVVALKDQSVDVIVSDVRMPGCDGINALKKIRMNGVTTPIIFLTTFDDSDLLLQARAAGAQGFLLKDAAPEELFEAIMSAVRGDALLQPVSLEPVRNRYQYHDQVAPTDTFNEKEIAILRLMAGGYSNKEIAKTLFLAEGTVKNYVSEILNKLDTRDRTRAVLKAITLRII